MTVAKKNGKAFRDRKNDRLVEARNFAVSGVAAGAQQTFDFKNLMEIFNSYLQQGSVPLVRAVLVSIQQTVSGDANAQLTGPYTAGMFERRALDTWNVNFPGQDEIFAPNNYPFDRASLFNFLALNMVNPQTVIDCLQADVPGGLFKGSFPRYAQDDGQFACLGPNGSGEMTVAPTLGFWGLDHRQQVIASNEVFSEPGLGDAPADWFILPMTRAGSAPGIDGMLMSALVQSNQSFKLYYTPRNNTGLYNSATNVSFGTFTIRVFLLIREERAATWANDPKLMGVPYYMQLQPAESGSVDLNVAFKVQSMGWGPEPDANVSVTLENDQTITVQFRPPSFPEYFSDNAKLKWYEQSADGSNLVRTFPPREDDTRLYQTVELWNACARSGFGTADVRLRSEIRIPRSDWDSTLIHEKAASSMTWTELGRINCGSLPYCMNFVSGVPFFPTGFVSPLKTFPGGPRHEGDITCAPRIEYNFPSTPGYVGTNANTMRNNWILIRDKADLIQPIINVSDSCSPCSGGPSKGEPIVDNPESPKDSLVDGMVGVQVVGKAAQAK